MKDPVEQIKEAFAKDDAESVRRLLQAHSALRAQVHQPVGDFGAPAVTMVRSAAMLDVLLEAGVDINAKSDWRAGGFGLLHNADPQLAAHAIVRGADVDVHAAARLGMLERLRELIGADPELVHARGGDGQTPLHFASTVEVAECLLDHGADSEARDVDHQSTPAQYMVRQRQSVLRYLIRRGCKTDILMAAALGDAQLVLGHLDAGPDCIRMRVSDEYSPMISDKNGGTIYQWTLGWYVSAHQVAKSFGHEEVFRLLMERSPADVRLAAACWLGDEQSVRALIVQQPNLAARLSAAERRQAAHAARHDDLPAVRLMLEAGWPVDVRSQHGGTPLHWAAWNGNLAMMRVILVYGPPLEARDSDYGSTPMGWAVHGSEHGGHRESGDYAATVEALAAAGAKLPSDVEGSEPVKDALRRLIQKSRE